MRGRLICDLDHTCLAGAIVEAADRCRLVCALMARSCVGAGALHDRWPLEFAVAEMRWSACLAVGGVAVWSTRAASVSLIGGRTNHRTQQQTPHDRCERSADRERQGDCSWSVPGRARRDLAGCDVRCVSPWMHCIAVRHAGVAAHAACGLPAREPAPEPAPMVGVSPTAATTQAAAGSLTCALTPSSCTMLPAASRPSATAVTTRSAPRTQSPPANRRGLLVW